MLINFWKNVAPSEFFSLDVTFCITYLEHCDIDDFNTPNTNLTTVISAETGSLSRNSCLKSGAGIPLKPTEYR